MPYIGADNRSIPTFNASLHSEPGPDSVLKALRKEMKWLQTKFTHKAANQETATAVSKVEASKYDSRSPRGPPTVAEENFCYRCGENGHYAGKCQNSENQANCIHTKSKLRCEDALVTHKKDFCSLKSLMTYNSILQMRLKEPYAFSTDSHIKE